MHAFFCALSFIIGACGPREDERANVFVSLLLYALVYWTRIADSTVYVETRGVPLEDMDKYVYLFYPLSMLTFLGSSETVCSTLKIFFADLQILATKMKKTTSRAMKTQGPTRPLSSRTEVVTPVLRCQLRASLRLRPGRLAAMACLLG